jgi:hypothetical protein
MAEPLPTERLGGSEGEEGPRRRRYLAALLVLLSVFDEEPLPLPEEEVESDFEADVELLSLLVSDFDSEDSDFDFEPPDLEPERLSFL